MLGRLLEIREANWLARNLVYQRLQFGFGHPLINPATVARVPESEEPPVEKEQRETEAAPISETSKDLKAPLLVNPTSPVASRPHLSRCPTITR